MSTSTDTAPSRVPWNKGRLTGQKPPLKLNDIWAIRVRLRLSSHVGSGNVQSRHRQQASGM